MGNENQGEVREVKEGGSVDFFDEVDESPSGVSYKADVDKAGEDDDAPEATEEATEEEVVEEEPEAEEEKEEEKEAEVEEKKEPEKKVPGAKKHVIVKNGDETLKLSPTATFQIPVNGKNVDVTLEDLKAEYAGKTNWSSKLQEVSTERKVVENLRETHKREVATVNGTINQMHEMIQKGDVRSAVYNLAEVMGGDPVETWAGVMKQTTSVINQILKARGGAELTDAELSSVLERDELDYHRGRRTRDQEKAKVSTTMSELDTRTRRLQDSFGKSEKGELIFSDRELVRIYDKLAANTPAADITPELCAEEFRKEFTESKVRKVCQAEKIDLAKNQKVLTSLLEVATRFPEFTEADLKVVLRESLGEKKTAVAAQMLSKKIRQGARPGDKPAPKKRVSEETFFEDLD